MAFAANEDGIKNKNAWNERQRGRTDRNLTLRRVGAARSLGHVGTRKKDRPPQERHERNLMLIMSAKHEIVDIPPLL